MRRFALAPSLRSQRRYGAFVLGAMFAGGITATSCATGGIAVNASVPDRVARYVAGSSGAVLPGEERRTVNVEITTSASELVLSGGRHGRLVIPYAAMQRLVYGPRFLLRSTGAAPEAQAPAYPWSARRHSFKNHYLKIEFRPDGHGQDEEVILTLGKALIKPTLAALERGSARSIVFEVLEACTQYKRPDECGMARREDLKGISTVFVDTTGSSEWIAGESYSRITTAITAAGLTLRLVDKVEDARIVLAFRYYGGTKPQFGGTYAIPDRAVGEVYVVDQEGPRVVMTFDETWNAWHMRLATRFANSFLAAYREANR